jgi:hypothetical protein
VSLAARLGWYARRLRSMEKGELLWRLQTVLPVRGGEPNFQDILLPGIQWSDALDRFGAAADRPILLDRARANFIADKWPRKVSELIAAADDFVGYSFGFFGYPAVSLKQPVDWLHDPIADIHWPDASAKRIDHRTAAGDVKWIWELNRLQHLPSLAQAWLFTGDSRYSRSAFEHLDTWLDQNPPGRGIAWRGAFEAGLRAISVAVALQGLRDAPELTEERYQRIVSMLHYSGFLCWRDRSLFSSANNHLVGEMTGLAVISMMFPELESVRQWERDAVGTLVAEAGKQILADGSGAEQSVGYQMATIELLNLVAALLVDRGDGAPAAICDAIARSSGFLTSVIGRSDPDPRYGDSDQEFAVRLGPETVRTVRDHLAIVAPFGRCATDPGTASTTLSAEWYRAVASAGDDSSTREPRTRGPNFYAPSGGLVVLRNGGRRTTVDVGSLGYLSIAAHGHADALAVTISQDGHDVIGDPGMGSYYSHPHWREVMRGTRAHPTVVVDGQNQSVIGGPFLWTRHAQTRVRAVNLEAGIVDAEHDGYTRLPGRVVHRRWVIAPPGDRASLIVDLVTGRGAHEVRTSWPLHPAVDSVRLDNRHLLSRHREPLMQLMHAATSPLVYEDVRGDESADLGWWSDRLESREPSWWLSAACRGELPVVIATLITPTDDVATSDFEVDLRGDRIQARWTEDDRRRRLTIQTAGSADVAEG